MSEEILQQLIEAKVIWAYVYKPYFFLSSEFHIFEKNDDLTAEEAVTLGLKALFITQPEER